MEENKLTQTIEESTTQNETSAQTKFCPNCGNPIKEDAKFCTNCGKPLNEAASTQVSVSNSAVPTAEPPKKNNKKKLIIIIVSVILAVLVIAGAVFGAMCINVSNKENQIADEWNAYLLESDSGKSRIDNIAGYNEQNLVLNKNLTGYICGFVKGEKTDDIEFTWEYYKSDDEYDYYKINMNESLFALMSYDPEEDNICFMLANKQDFAVYYKR